MKYIVVVLLILLGNQGHSQLIDYAALDTVKVFYSLEKALVNPNDVYRLDLSKTKLKTFPQDILKLKNLNELVLDKNKLDSIPVAISELQYLQSISFFRNRIGNIDFILALPNLRKIDFTSNFIFDIPEDIWKLVHLEEVIFQLNPISKIPDTLGELEFLKVLNLLDIDLNVAQQQRIATLLPQITVQMSEPCYCNYDD